MSSPLQPVYPFVAPGEPLEVLTTNACIGDEPADEVRIWAPLRRNASLRFAADADGLFDLDASTMRIAHPSLGASAVNVSLSDGRGLGRVEATTFGGQSRISSVVLHWLNLPVIESLIGATTEMPRGRWSTEAGPWRLTLEGRQDLNDTIRTMRYDDQQYAMTHVGELSRIDGMPFASSEAEDVIFGWQLAMSFALGRWVAPALPVGFDSGGMRVWEQWAPWRCDEMFGYQCWWNDRCGDDLGSFVARFLAAFLDDDHRAVTRYVASYTIAGNHSGTTAEGKVMLAFAGLDYLGWVDLKLAEKVSRQEYKDLGAARRLRLLLDEAGIPTATPQQLDALIQLGTAESDVDADGPGTASWVRNRLVHPKDPKSTYKGAYVWQAAQLLLEYAELLLLRRIGYTGEFQRRYPPGRSQWEHEPVPWSRPNPANTAS